MNIYTHSVYWIHLPTHSSILSDGYIGVSNNPTRRLKEHLNASPLRNDKNPFFGRAINKYKNDIILTIIFCGTQEACYTLEKELRPTTNTGWNSNVGGKTPPTKKGWKPSSATLEKRSASLKGIPRDEQWCKNLSEAKKGDKNGMYGQCVPCSRQRKISIIRAKNEHRVNELITVLIMLKEGNSIRSISKKTKYSTSAIHAIKKDPTLHFEAFPVLKQFKTS